VSEAGTARGTITDLVPLIHVSDVARSIEFYEALGFAVSDRYEPSSTLELAALEATASARIILARADEPARVDPDGHGHMVAEIDDDTVGQ